MGKTGYWNLKAAIPFDSLETLKQAYNSSEYDQSIDWDMSDNI